MHTANTALPSITIATDGQSMSSRTNVHCRSSPDRFDVRLMRELKKCYIRNNAQSSTVGLLFVDQQISGRYGFMSCAKIASDTFGIRPSTYSRNLRHFANCMQQIANARVAADYYMRHSSQDHWNAYILPERLSNEMHAFINSEEQRESFVRQYMSPPRKPAPQQPAAPRVRITVSGKSPKHLLQAANSSQTQSDDQDDAAYSLSFTQQPYFGNE